MAEEAKISEDRALENARVSKRVAESARGLLQDRLDGLTRVIHWTGISADHVTKARMVDERLLEEPELRSNRVVKVLQAFTQDVRVLMAESSEVRVLMAESSEVRVLMTSCSRKV